MRSLRLVALGALIAYFFDRENGRARRKALTERLAELRSSGGSPELSDDLVAQTRTTG